MCHLGSRTKMMENTIVQYITILIQKCIYLIIYLTISRLNSLFIITPIIIDIIIDHYYHHHYYYYCYQYSGYYLFIYLLIDTVCSVEETLKMITGKFYIGMYSDKVLLCSSSCPSGNRVWPRPRAGDVNREGLRSRPSRNPSSGRNGSTGVCGKVGLSSNWFWPKGGRTPNIRSFRINELNTVKM